MGKRHKKTPVEDNPVVEVSIDSMGYYGNTHSSEVLDVVWMLLENADVDAKNRKIIWEDGKRLSITESMQRIHADYPDFPLEPIEDHLIGWLDIGFAPSSYSQEQLDELDRLTEQWIDDHERQAQPPPKKPRRTRHS